jgi:hypothetical protein
MVSTKAVIIVASKPVELARKFTSCGAEMPAAAGRARRNTVLMFCYCSYLTISFGIPEALYRKTRPELTFGRMRPFSSAMAGTEKVAGLDQVWPSALHPMATFSEAFLLSARL